MKICANWAAERTVGKVFVLMRSAMGREIDSQMVHLAEILKPDYFASAPSVAKDVGELDQTDGTKNYSYYNPSFLVNDRDQQLAEVSLSESIKCKTESSNERE